MVLNPACLSTVMYREVARMSFCDIRKTVVGKATGYYSRNMHWPPATSHAALGTLLKMVSTASKNNFHMNKLQTLQTAHIAMIKRQFFLSHILSGRSYRFLHLIWVGQEPHLRMTPTDWLNQCLCRLQAHLASPDVSSSFLFRLFLG